MLLFESAWMLWQKDMPKDVFGAVGFGKGFRCVLVMRVV